MSVEVVYWERRDAADREEMGRVALELTRGQRARDGVSASRFYWATPDRIVVQTHTDAAGVLDSDPPPEVAKHLFALSDLARQAGRELWVEPGAGERSYRSAGR